MSAVLFFIAAIGALGGAIGVVMLRNQFYSVLALVIHLVCLAALFLLLRAEFVAAAQVIVYAGAVMVLYVFVVAYVGGGEERATRSGLRLIGPLLALALAIELCVALLGTALKGISSKGAIYIVGFGTPTHIGKLFLTTYLLPFEIASLLLLVAAIGAIVLARRRRGLDPDQDPPARYPALPAWVGSMAEAGGIHFEQEPPMPAAEGEPVTPGGEPAASEGEAVGSEH
ncbi:MAG TPA: NADH-quinone oxidoreductase subunit J [Solirubrobacteraceae bacterium]|nr:NADH-quinone oxidoreductase subunit J [Solirubrobacteraceae bacterium]